MLHPAGFLILGLEPSKTQYCKRTFSTAGFFTGYLSSTGFLSGGHWVLHPGFKTSYLKFGSLLNSLGIPTYRISIGWMIKRAVSHFDYNPITFYIKCDPFIVWSTYLEFEYIWLRRKSCECEISDKWSVNTILVNITIFCKWNMSNWVPLLVHDEIEFRGDLYDSFPWIVSFCGKPTSLVSLVLVPLFHSLYSCTVSSNTSN